MNEFITDRMHPHAVCPIHDEFLDSETGRCDHCDREVALDRAAAHEDACPACDGEAVVEARHPQWGQRGCPEDVVLVDCRACAGTGIAH